MKTGSLLIALVSAVLLSAPAAPALAADAPGDYAYVFVQGRIIDPNGTDPLIGATVRLKSEGRSFEATTDGKGLFVFEKLPVATYEMTVTAPDGRVVRTLQRVAPREPVPDRARLEARLGYGPAAVALIEPGESRVEVTVPDPPTNWPRFWKQMAIFVGTAGLLAL